MSLLHYKSEIARWTLNGLGREPSTGWDPITKRLRSAIWSSFRGEEDLTTCGEGGIRTHGGDQPHNGFRDRPIQPLWHLSILQGGIIAETWLNIHRLTLGWIQDWLNSIFG